ncbi:MAG: rod shape-determining protein MreD [Winogradskyella sp.]
MTSITITHITKFISLVLLQVLICNHINFLGYINPYIYIIFILLYPVSTNRLLFLFLSFLLGLLIDSFSDSGGVHAAAAVSLAYIRPVFLKTAFKVLYEHHNIKIANTDIGSLITYIVFGTFLHHLILFSLEVFNITNLLLILKKTLFSGVFTIILSLLLIIIFSRDKK